MEQARDTTTSADMLIHSARTTAGVAADPEVAGLEGDFVVVHVKLKTCVRSIEDKEEEVQGKLAVFLIRDLGLDRAVRHFELALFSAVEKDRDNAIYERYFKDGLRAITEAEPRVVEPAMVAEMLLAMTADAGNPLIGPLVIQHSPLLQAALTLVNTSATDLGKSETELAYLSNKVLAGIRADWIAENGRLHGKLQTAFPRDRERVESYFSAFRKPPKKSVPIDHPEPVAATPATPTATVPPVTPAIVTPPAAASTGSSH